MTPEQADEIIALLRRLDERLAAIEAKLPGPANMDPRINSTAADIREYRRKLKGGLDY
jgi:hypothetical protein